MKMWTSKQLTKKNVDFKAFHKINIKKVEFKALDKINNQKSGLQSLWQNYQYKMLTSKLLTKLTIKNVDFKAFDKMKMKNKKCELKVFYKINNIIWTSKQLTKKNVDFNLQFVLSN